MAESTLNNESRDDILHVPNLFEYFCQRTSDDFRQRASDAEPPAMSFATLVLAILMAVAFTIFGRPQLARAAFVVVGILVLWTVWGVVVRSNSRTFQKADDIRNGSFSPDSAPFVLARLKWWNHLVSPGRWGGHSRIYDRRNKLERKLGELQKKVAAMLEADPESRAAYTPPSEDEIADLNQAITTFTTRKTIERETSELPDPLVRLRGELLLYQALSQKLEEMSDKLERIDKLAVMFQNFSPSDLSQVVNEAIQVLEERRILVLQVDRVDPGDFIDMVSVRTE